MEAQGEGVGGREGQRAERKGREVIPFPVQLLISANGTEKPGLMMFLFNPCFVNAADTPPGSRMVRVLAGTRWQLSDGTAEESLIWGPFAKLWAA